ncbi:hypothetical protein EYF80_012945 [Liparis tanakae]|uniref:Uncharacterized protein n=1 Tax=Liparis tanakae TaxID=230148 RepID=A0A4Z2IHU1_9TELE|nr:hypothetical protein EYF80_012945 [Liparis tanakae]
MLCELRSKNTGCNDVGYAPGLDHVHEPMWSHLGDRLRSSARSDQICRPASVTSYTSLSVPAIGNDRKKACMPWHVIVACVIIWLQE